MDSNQQHKAEGAEILFLQASPMFHEAEDSLTVHRPDRRHDAASFLQLFGECWLRDGPPAVTTMASNERTSHVHGIPTHTNVCCQGCGEYE
jgi:hypothetical protein